MKTLALVFVAIVLLPCSVFSQPIEISTPDQLQAIGADETSLAGEYILVNDIDLAGYPWKAIFLFAGTFDGNGHIIKNLTTNNEEHRAGGLIGKSLAGSVVKNVGVVDCNITSKDYSAAVVGDSHGDVSNCFCAGGSVTTVGTGNVGSFCGMNRGTSSITNCYSIGVDVTGLTANTRPATGGFIGTAGGLITNCYYVGGVITPAPDSVAGGFAGQIPGTATSCYFNLDEGGIATFISTGTTAEPGGRTTAEMMQEATYVGWDFADVWSIDEGQGYPQLRMPPEVQEPVTITVPNSDFEAIFMPGSDTVTADLGDGWTQGVGPNTLMDSGIATYSDGTTGDAVDIPGWIGADPQGWIDNGGTYDRDTNFPNRQGSFQVGGVEGSYSFLANGGDWGNPAGGLIVSEASLGQVERGTYTLSVLAIGPDGPATPVVLELLADGVALVPASSVDPELSGDWQEVSRTYDAASLEGLLGASLTIRLGVGRQASGGQTRFDDVRLSFLTDAIAVAVPNGDFEAIYMPGSDTITADLGGGWTQGLGPDTPMDDGVATYSDGTTGDAVDIPGWIGADAQGWIDNGGTYDRDTNFPNRQGSVARQSDTPDGLYYYLSNGGDWGNAAGGLIVSDAPLATAEGGLTYTLSVLANGGATPIVLELLADGVALVPASSVDPELSGDWQEFSRTYDAVSLDGHLGESLTIRLGVGRGASGGQSHLDAVSLSYVQEPITITVPNGDFETLYKPGTAVTGVVAVGGWSMGVGPDCPIDGGTGYEFSDGTTGANADIAGWVGYDMDGWVADGGTYERDITNGNFQGNISLVDGNQMFGANGGGWGNPAGGLIVSDAPLATVEDGLTYTLSMVARGPDGPAIPVVLELLADGVALTPSASVDPELTGEWQEVSRTYDAASLAGVLGQDLTIVLGVDRGASGGQTHFDDVSLASF